MNEEQERKITVKAMVCRYHYKTTFVHSLEDLKNDSRLGRCWEEFDNYNKTYVLTGRK